MAKQQLHQLYVLIVILISCWALSCTATTYTVGDSSGWDISSNLDTWETGKRFYVGDALIFTFSSSDSLEEVTQPNFKTCNTSNYLKSYTNGNTTIVLSKPGERYFISGNKLYCYGGMKLQVNVENNQAYSPAIAPQSNQGSILKKPSSNNSNIPNSSSGVNIYGGWDNFVIVFLCFIATMLWV